jgi:hypothetical protein
MDDSDKNKLKDVLSSIDPVEFQWNETNTTVGVVAQEIGSIDLGNYSTTAGQALPGVVSIGAAGANQWANGSSISFTNTAAFHADTTEYGKNTIKTPRVTIDIDELADMMETVKKRLLILTPDFEKHEKYPMLKELYNEYKAMERLLSGPDTDE